MNQRIFLLVLVVAVVKGLPVEKTAKAKLNQNVEGKTNLCGLNIKCDYSDILTVVARWIYPNVVLRRTGS